MTCIKGLILRANTHAKKARALLGDIIRGIMHAPPEKFFPDQLKMHLPYNICYIIL
jgi:hypothetical protein